MGLHSLISPAVSYELFTFSYLLITLPYQLVICKYSCSICHFLSSEKETGTLTVFLLKEAIALGKHIQAFYCYIEDTRQ